MSHNLPPEAVELRLRLLYDWLLGPLDNAPDQTPVIEADQPPALDARAYARALRRHKPSLGVSDDQAEERRNE